MLLKGLSAGTKQHPFKQVSLARLLPEEGGCASKTSAWMVTVSIAWQEAVPVVECEGHLRHTQCMVIALSHSGRHSRQRVGQCIRLKKCEHLCCVGTLVRFLNYFQDQLSFSMKLVLVDLNTVNFSTPS